MKTRRYSIKYQEGELIILALTALIEEIEKNEDFKNSAYWEWTLKACKELNRKLKNYTWEIR